MRTTYTTQLGDRGRLVVPAALRASQHWDQGTPLLLVETDSGVVVTTRAQARVMLQEQLGANSLVAELLDERRAAATHEDVA